MVAVGIVPQLVVVDQVVALVFPQLFFQLLLALQAKEILVVLIRVLAQIMVVVAVVALEEPAKMELQLKVEMVVLVPNVLQLAIQIIMLVVVDLIIIALVEQQELVV